MDAGELLPLEVAFWRAAGDRERYAAGLAAGAVHVFPGWGITELDAVLDGVEAAEPWETFAIEEPRLVPLGEEAAALVYRARATRAGEPPYIAAITSVYRREAGAWRLALHQQTPLAGPSGEQAG